MDKPRSHVRKQQSVHWHFILTLSRSDFEGKCSGRICLWENRNGKRYSLYVWHGPLKNQLVFLCGELQLNYVAKWDLSSIVPGLLFPTAEKEENLIYGSQIMYFVKKPIRIDILCLIQNWCWTLFINILRQNIALLLLGWNVLCPPAFYNC